MGIPMWDSRGFDWGLYKWESSRQDRFFGPAGGRLDRQGGRNPPQSESEPAPRSDDSRQTRSDAETPDRSSG